MSEQQAAEPNSSAESGAPDEPGVPEMSDMDLERMRRERFRRRVERVLAAMNKERIDWRGVPFIAEDGRIGVRVEPVEMLMPQQ